MIRVVAGIAFLVFFTLGPLFWLHLGLAWMPIAIAFVIIPLMDAAVGVARSSEPSPIPMARWIPRLQLPLQVALLTGAVSVASALSIAEMIVFAIAVGTVTGGTGITVAHELGHRASRLDRAIAKLLLVTVGYGHFYVEHIRGHHVRVATPDDPATAPRGMNVYRFVLRSIVGSFRHAWKLEVMRLAARGMRWWHPSNWVLTGSLLSLSLFVAGIASAGWQAGALLLVQAAWAVVLLEIINYIEHYGLQRRRVGGRFEPVRPEHSWNADFPLSNWVLFNLQLHSDHHAKMDRSYEHLRSVATAPQLPAGYPAMIVVALWPPAWFALMDPRLPPLPQ